MRRKTWQGALAGAGLLVTVLLVAVYRDERGEGILIRLLFIAGFGALAVGLVAGFTTVETELWNRAQCAVGITPTGYTCP